MKQPISGLVPENRLGIATDLYQLTMANGYSFHDKQDEIATFDLFVRKLPKTRSYLMVAGLEQALYYLLNMRFTNEDIEMLRKMSIFRNAQEKFWDYLSTFRFTGSVMAMPEGSIAFGNEPMMTVSAPLIEAQIAETYLLTCFNHQTKIASKASRCVEAAVLGFLKRNIKTYVYENIIKAVDEKIGAIAIEEMKNLGAIFVKHT